MTTHLYLCLAVVLLIFQTAMPMEFRGKYSAIFNFGDSLSDTGNYRYTEHVVPDYGHIPPYGITYFHRPAGRWTDGRVILDFIAQSVGLPLLRPYLEGGCVDDFKYGANFAVAGATAIPNSFYTEQGINATWPKNSFEVQINLFIKELLPSLSDRKSGSSEILRNSLVFVGEIGGNDYIFSLTAPEGRKSIEWIKSNLSPRITKIITNSAEILIEHGAKTLAIPGITPLGCVASLLTLYYRDNTEGYYDRSTGCINWLNEFSMYHNSLIQNVVTELRKKHPEVVISYIDYYGPLIRIYQNPIKYGFKVPLVACCGGNGPYNWNATTHCGDNGANLCNHISTYVSWDGVHYTEEAHKVIVRDILKGRIFRQP